MTKQKYYLKNDKIEHVLLDHFLNDKNHTQVVSWEEKTLVALIFAYT